MMLTESDRTSLKTLKSEMSRDMGVSVDLSGIPTTLLGNDSALANTLSKGAYILGYEFVFHDDRNAEHSYRLHPVTVVIRKAPSLARKPLPFLVPGALYPTRTAYPWQPPHPDSLMGLLTMTAL